MGLLDGLFGEGLRGISSAALGASTGLQRGAAEGYRRQQAAEDRAARQQQMEINKIRLQQSKKELDPYKDVRARFGMIGQRLVDRLTDPASQADFATPEGQQFRSGLQRAAEHAFGVANGTVPPEQADQTLLHLFGGEPPPSAAPAPPAPEAPSLTPDRRPTPFEQRTADIDQGRAAPPLPTAPARLGPVREQAFGRQSLPFQLPQPEIPTVAPGLPTAPRAPEPAPPARPAPPPPTPKQRLLALLDSPVTEETLPRHEGEQGKAYAARLARAQSARTAEINSLVGVVGALPKAAAAEATLPYAAKTARAKLEGAQANTGLARSRTLTEDFLRGRKGANFDSQIRERGRANDLRAQGLAETGRHNQAMERLGQMNAATNAASKKGLPEYRAAMTAAAQFRMDHFSEAEMGKNNRAELAQVLRALSQKESLPGGFSSSTITDSATQKRLLDRLGAISQRIDASIQQHGGGAPAAAPDSASNDFFTEGIRRHIQAGTFKSTLGRAPKGVREDMLRAYQQIKGRPYGGK